MKKLWFTCLVTAVLLFAAAISVSAEDVSKEVTLSPGNPLVTDANYNTYSAYDKGSALTVTAAPGKKLSSLYIVFDRTPGAWTLTANGVSVSCGKYGFLHEFVNVAALCGEADTVTLQFPESGVVIADIYAFSAGALPDWVQVWKPAEGECDLMLTPSHADDDQLFFLGVLPYYAGEMGYEVQVVYFTNHWGVHNRPHELLNGLWTVGVTRYPVIGILTDSWDGSTKTLEYGYNAAAYFGCSKDALIKFQVENLRKFRPQVVIAHDFAGEYGHPQHMINADTMKLALEKANDSTYDTDSAGKYGLWDVPKAYFHLYGEHTITMNWDVPLSHFGGATAYEVSRNGYACHLSQQYTWFTRWLKGSSGEITKASQITSYSPTSYGLYKTTVGYDKTGGDFFENLTVRSQIPPETEPETEPVTEPVTSLQTDPATSGGETASANPVPGQSAGQTESGGSSDGTGGLIAILVLLFCAMLLIVLFLLIRSDSGKGNTGKRKRR